jgi:hypothetical protein
VAFGWASLCSSEARQALKGQGDQEVQAALSHRRQGSQGKVSERTCLGRRASVRLRRVAVHRGLTVQVLVGNYQVLRVLAGNCQAHQFLVENYQGVQAGRYQGVQAALVRVGSYRGVLVGNYQTLQVLVGNYQVVQVALALVGRYQVRWVLGETLLTPEGRVRDPETRARLVVEDADQGVGGHLDREAGNASQDRPRPASALAYVTEEKQQVPRWAGSYRAVRE